mgnify:CR=1 FL=1
MKQRPKQSDSFHAVKIKVIPRSKKRGIIFLAENEYEVRVGSAPIGGKANEEAIEMVSKELGVPKSTITIKAGEHNRNKFLEIEERCQKK